MKKLLITTLLIPLLIACERDDGCRQASRLGEELGRLGLPADANRVEVARRCRADFEAAWVQGNTAYCNADGAFAIGYSDAVYYGVCRDAAFLEAYRLGRTLWVLEVERQAVADQLALLEEGRRQPVRADEAADLTNRGRELDRSITDLRTVARNRGLLSD